MAGFGSIAPFLTDEESLLSEAFGPNFSPDPQTFKPYTPDTPAPVVQPDISPAPNLSTPPAAGGAVSNLPNWNPPDYSRVPPWPGTSGQTSAAPAVSDASYPAVYRQQFAKELADPALKNRFFAITNAEVGGQGPKAAQAFMETVMNRAASRGQTIAQTLQGPYYPGITYQHASRYYGGGLEDRYGPAYDEVMKGSNLSNWATGNASGTVGFAGGPMVYNPGTGERFGIEGPDRAWARRMASGGTPAPIQVAALGTPVVPQNAPVRPPPTPATPPAPAAPSYPTSAAANQTVPGIDVRAPYVPPPPPPPAPPPPDPNAVDWSSMNKPFGTLTRRPEDEIEIATKNPLVQFTRGDIQRGINIAMATSGGGLGTKPWMPGGAGFHEAIEGLPHGNIPEPHPAAAGGTAAPEAGGGAVGGQGAGDVTGGASGGDARLGPAQAQAETAAGKYAPLPGLPQKAIQLGDQLYVPGPIGKIKDVAEQYMRGRIASSYHTPPEMFHKLDPEHSKAIAQAFEEMPHNPDDPATRNSYQAMIDETRQQYDAIRQYHPELQLIPNKPGEDPYAANPRLTAQDVIQNNRLHFFPTEQGYGTGEQDLANNPMLQPSGRTLNGKPLLNNDLFRVVHDYFGHLQEGYGFRAEGEDNAWRKHASMYSDVARPAMTSETRGQNSWVNFGPHAEANKGASGADTIYAPQKIGLMPEWTMRDRGSPEPMITYRGGPQPYSMVDMSKIGTGEGSGVRGHGMYSAEASPIASFYRYMTATLQDPLLKKYKLNPFDASNLGRDLASTNGDHQPVIDELNDHITNLKAKVAEGDTSAMTKNQITKSRLMIRYLNDPKRASGHMYQLALDRPDEHYLHWDRPFSEQSQYIKDKFAPILKEQTPIVQDARNHLLAKAKAQMARNPQGVLQQKLENDIKRYSAPVDWSNTLGQNLYGIAAHRALGRAPKDPEEAYPVASQYLRAKGIAGIKYLAGQNFNLPEGVPKGSHNYVNFNPERILKRYAIPGLIGAGALGGAGMLRNQQNGS